MSLSQSNFETQFETFKGLILQYSGKDFVSFNEGTPREWESYKPILRDKALDLLEVAVWENAQIGTGEILNRVIDSIEIKDTPGFFGNNLVNWVNRWGHASRSHSALLDARQDPNRTAKFEDWIIKFYQSQIDDGEGFDQLVDLVGKRYDLAAYLYFLKDIENYMPIAPTHFDKAFNLLGIDLKTAQQCSWDNYREYNDALKDVKSALVEFGGLNDVRLVDAHSFCWMLVVLEKAIEQEKSGGHSQGTATKDPGTIYDSRAKSVYEMADTTEKTAKYAQGQTVEQTVKVKELRMSRSELENHISELLDKQEDKCALTGISLEYRGDHIDDQLLPSLDRIDSDGHYEIGNLQVVCRFINFWKSNTPDEEFKRLLSLVRGDEDYI